MTVSIKDVAARAGVSVGTVSNVLNRRESVSREISERVAKAISELGYVRNDAARQLRAGDSRTIGLVMPDIGNPFFADIARGADQRATEAGMAVLIVTSGGDAARETSLLDMLQEQRIRGILIAPASDDVSQTERLTARGTPVVLIDRTAKSHALQYVAVDDVAGGRLAAQHLLDLGRRRIAFVAGPATTRQVIDRLSGVQLAIDATPGAVLVASFQEAMTVPIGRASGESIARRAPEERPDAVFAANDLLAIGILEALTAAALRIPEDIAVIGYDDIDFAATSVVSLSSVRQPAVAMGYAAVDLLLNPQDDPHRRGLQYQPELVTRSSTVPQSRP